MEIAVVVEAHKVAVVVVGTVAELVPVVPGTGVEQAVAAVIALVLVVEIAVVVEGYIDQGLAVAEHIVEAVVAVGTVAVAVVVEVVERLDYFDQPGLGWLLISEVQTEPLRPSIYQIPAEQFLYS